MGLILIGYGCLGLLKNGKVFLGLAFVMRIFEACGNSMFLTGNRFFTMKEYFQSHHLHHHHHFYHEKVFSKSSSSPGSFSAIAREFPDKVASMFAMIELFFGIGEKIQSLLKIVRSCFQNPPPPLNTTC